MKIGTQSILIPFIVLCLGLCQQVQSATDTPDPGGSLPASNTADGQLALASLTTGIYNSAFGIYSLLSLTDGNFCTAIGGATLLVNTASENTATGAGALLSNTTGNNNTANGAFALFSNNTGGFNTAIGDRVLFKNTAGDHNVAVGGGGLPGPALFSNTLGRFNTAVGEGALFSNTEGDDNTAIGAGALADNTEGSENVAVGLSALGNSSGDNNVALGNLAGFNQTNGSNNVYIGTQITGTAGESNACYIASIFNQTSLGGSPVFVDANSKLGTLTSSKRFKEEIKPMDKTSDALFALKPVTFRYKKEIDPAGTSQFGLVAEEVAKVNPALVTVDKEGKPYSVRYDKVDAMLLNEFLKEHRRVQEQQKEIDSLKAELTEQRDLIQKVSDRLEITKPASKVAVSTP